MAKATTKTAKKSAKNEEVAAPKPARVIERGDGVVEAKLKALYELQLIDSEIDRIRTVRGELPLEVQDLEDEITGLQTRVDNASTEAGDLEKAIADKKQLMKDAKAAIKKYETQQANVRNNREYDSLSKEIEFQKLEIQLAEKRIAEYEYAIAAKGGVNTDTSSLLKEKKKEYEHKKAELDDIVAETQKEEEALLKKSKKAQELIEERLLNAYHRVRTNARNGLAVVVIQRDACGGCFNSIPPQRQLDIASRKKIIVCEHCGRILVDAEFVGAAVEA